MNYHDDKEYLTSTDFRSYLKYGRIKRHDSSDTLDFGSMAHMRFLEPGKYKNVSRVTEAIDRRTSAGKEAFKKFQAMQEANPELIFVTEQDNAAFEAMTTNLLKIELIVKILEQAKIECPVFGKISRVKCKCKPDILTTINGETLLIDYKTTSDVSEFKYSIRKYRYDIQLAFYAMVLENQGINVNRHIIIAQESIPPYDFQIFELSAQVIQGTKLSVLEGIERLEVDSVLGFTGYSKDIILLESL